jgi:hypothetical protein
MRSVSLQAKLAITGQRYGVAGKQSTLALLLPRRQASPSTTHHDLELDLRMKERALRKLQSPPSRAGRFKPPDRLLQCREAL